MIAPLALAALLLAAPDSATTPSTNGTSSANDAIPTQLSLAKAEEIFLARGLDVLIAEANAEGAAGDRKAAGAHPNPNLNLTGLYGPETTRDLLGGSLGQKNPGGNSPYTTWGLQFAISDNAAIEDQLSGKRSLRIQATAKALAAAQANIADVQRLELFQLRQAYVAAVTALLNLQSAQQSLLTYDQQRQLNQIRFDKGAISGLDLARILQSQLEGQQARDQAIAGYQQAVAAVVQLLGVRSGIPGNVALTTGIDYLALPSLKSATADSLFQLALSHRTDLQMARATLEQKQLVSRQARRAVLPDIQVQAGYGEQCNAQTCSSDPSFNLGLQGNLPVLYQQQGEIQRADSDVAAARRSLDKVQAQVVADVSQSFAGFVASEKLVTRMERDLLIQAEKSRNLAQLLYQKGSASLLDFLDAQRTYVATVLEYHADLASYWTAVFQLEQATNVRLH